MKRNLFTIFRLYKIKKVHRSYKIFEIRSSIPWNSTIKRLKRSRKSREFKKRKETENIQQISSFMPFCRQGGNFKSWWSIEKIGSVLWPMTSNTFATIKPHNSINHSGFPLRKPSCWSSRNIMHGSTKILADKRKKSNKKSIQRLCYMFQSKVTNY